MVGSTMYTHINIFGHKFFLVKHRRLSSIALSGVFGRMSHTLRFSLLRHFLEDRLLHISTIFLQTFKTKKWLPWLRLVLRNYFLRRLIAAYFFFVAYLQWHFLATFIIFEARSNIIQKLLFAVFHQSKWFVD